VSNYFSKDFDPELKEDWVQGHIDKWIAESGAREITKKS
jgi:hypothetical protein